MLAQKFSSYYCSGSNSNIWKSRPCNVFSEKHLYTQWDDNGKADVSIERDFAALEGVVSRIIDKVVDQAQKGRVCRLDANEKDSWLRFLVHQRRRTPDVRPMVNKRMECLVGEIPDAYEAHVGRSLTPEERAQSGHPDFLKTVRRNAFSNFAATKPREDTWKKLLDTSVLTGVIRNPKKSFVIGSQPIADFHDWFPVHCKVAVRLTSPHGSDKLIVFDDIVEIRQINEDIVTRSTTFAGPSQYLIESLAHPR